MKISKLILSLSLTLSFNSWAGDVGNGGMSVVCRNTDGSITSAELLDIYEGRELYQRTYADDLLSVETRIQLMLLNLVKKPEAIDKFQAELSTIYANAVFVGNENELELTNDALPIIRKKGCKLEQVANYTDNGEIFISQEIYEEFDNLNKAALYVHESFYSLYRKFNKKMLPMNSRDSRKLTAYLMAKQVDQNVVSALLKKHIDVPCGLEGTIEQRTQDCSLVKGNYLRVSRTNNGDEIYKDSMSGLLWSDRLPLSMNQANAMAACAKLENISEKTWRLPTKTEFQNAYTNGIRDQLPNMDGWFWSSSKYDSKDESQIPMGDKKIWVFNGYSNNQFKEILSLNDYFMSGTSVRCVAD